MTDYQRTPKEIIRERAKRHMQKYSELNPGSKPKPIDNKRLGCRPGTGCRSDKKPLEDIV